MIAVAFLPIFTLVDQEGRLFKPLAYTKNLAMAIAALLAITLDPALRMLFTRMDPFTFRPRWLARLANARRWSARYYPEEQHPISRVALPRLRAGLPLRAAPSAGGHRAPRVAGRRSRPCPSTSRLGREFMPPLNEGALLYMPTTLPGISRRRGAASCSQMQDRVLRSFPEVERVFGKAGRAETSTDPAPFSMMETTVVLKPGAQWRRKPRWYSSWAPDWLKPPSAPLWPDRISWEELVDEMDAALQLPGHDQRLDDADQEPHRHAHDRHAHAGRHQGLRRRPRGDRSASARQLERRSCATCPARAASSPSASPAATSWTSTSSATQLARYGLTVDDAQDVIMSAIGGENVTTTIEGRERYPVNVRYPRELRDDIDQPRPRPRADARRAPRSRSPSSPTSQMVAGPGDDPRRERPARRLRLRRHRPAATSAATSRTRSGRSAASSRCRAGYSLEWSGQYENMLRVRERLKVVVPVTLVLIFFLLYVNTQLGVEGRAS